MPELVDYSVNYFPDKMFKTKVQTHSFALLAVSSFFQGSIRGLKNVVRSVGFTLVSVSIPQTLENASRLAHPLFQKGLKRYTLSTR